MNPVPAEATSSLVGGNSNNTDEMEIGEMPRAQNEINNDSAVSLVRVGDITTFELIMTTCVPAIEHLLLNLSTRDIINLYHTNRRFRDFLHKYPLAWKNLSFRQPYQRSSAAGDTPRIITGTLCKPHSPDFLLRVILPLSPVLARLELDSSTASGSELYGRVLTNCRSTLKHLSVRYCINVSLRCHILPFLELEHAEAMQSKSFKRPALESIYTWNCRHHHSLPYLRSALAGWNSECFPTHHLINMCHHLSIWTDTAWCPSHGVRCRKRANYARGRLATNANEEVWVPFDRLWRSQNMLGHLPPRQLPPEDKVGSLKLQAGQFFSSEAAQGKNLCQHSYCPWVYEDACLGEPLGVGGEPSREGKEVPTHLRKSHTLFVDNVRCTTCHEEIDERCETCSIAMHCQGCRVTLCASCAYRPPLPWKQAKAERILRITRPKLTNPTRSTLHSIAKGRTEAEEAKRKMEASQETLTCLSKPLFWWAPNADTNPNLLMGGTQVGPFHQAPNPLITFRQCCSNHRPGLGLIFRSTMAAVPLPRGVGFENLHFQSSRSFLHTSHVPIGIQARNQERNQVADGYPDQSLCRYRSRAGGYNRMYWEIIKMRTRKVPEVDLEELFNHVNNRDTTAGVSPRVLCENCFNIPNWRIPCAIAGCRNEYCIEHNVSNLRFLLCGARNLLTEFEAFLANKAGPAVDTEQTKEKLDVDQMQSIDMDDDTSGPRFRGCRRLFCRRPVDMDVGETIPSCEGSKFVKTCESCGVNACYDCCGMEMACPCSVCSNTSQEPFRCPACLGDWPIAQNIAKKIVHLARAGRRWPGNERHERFWRCKVYEEDKGYDDVTESQNECANNFT